MKDTVPKAKQGTKQGPRPTAVPSALEETLDTVTDLLASYLGQGHQCREYELIRWLQEPAQAIFQSNALSDTMMLFRANFIVMHCLYRLRQRWLDEQRGYLTISSLEVGLQPISEASENQLPGEHDPLADYYLNLNHLDTDEASVEALLNDFWRRMVVPEQNDEDFATLQLQPPTDAHTLRQQYRRLANQHHPDKGGDSEQFRKITAAYQRLKYAF
jgi:hypothetical protein